MRKRRRLFKYQDEEGKGDGREREEGEERR